MPDIIAISSILTSLKTALDLAKSVKESSTSLSQAEIDLKIAGLVTALAEAKIEVANVQDEILKRDDEICKLKNKLQVKGNMVWDKPYYWYTEGEEKQGPFCQKCYDSDEKMIRLQGGGKKYWRCTVCKTKYADANYEERKISVPNRRGFNR